MYVVVSEECYGGDLKGFFTKEAAQAFSEKRIEETDGKIDFIVKKIDYQNHRPSREWNISVSDKAHTTVNIRVESATDEVCDHLIASGVFVDENELHSLIGTDE